MPNAVRERFLFLLRRVSEDGVDWWANLPEWRNESVLPPAVIKNFCKRHVIESLGELNSFLDLDRYTGDAVKRLIPIRSNNHLKAVFFLLPTWENTATPTGFRAQVQLWTAQNSCLNVVGMRFEIGDPRSPTHAYAHAQFCRDFFKRQPAEQSFQLPVQYPALPIPAADAVDLLLVVLISTLGYKETSLGVFDNAPDLSLSLEKRKHLPALRERIAKVASPMTL